MSAHSHSHSHTPGHTHAHSVGSASARALALALVLTLLFVGVEVAAGIIANSLALLTDAAHNVTDVFALGISWYTLRLAHRPAQPGRTYGFHRAGILAALFNATTLLVVAGFIAVEAYRRLGHPPEVQGPLLTAAAAVAFAVNLGTALLLRRGSRHDLNVRSAYVHLMADAVSTVAALVAGIGIALTGWNWLDPVASLLISVLIVINAVGITRETAGILLENTPSDVDMQALLADLRAIPGVLGVHDLHVWSITQEKRALSAHLRVADAPISAGARIQQAVNDLLLRRYEIGHATLQLECAGCEPDLLYCDMEQPSPTR